MKKINKGYIFAFIIGGLVFGCISVYATLSLTAEDVTYGSGTVKSALDTLYTKAKPAYTGSTTVTPTTSEQTLSTANTILNSDITVGAIPSTYKNLTQTTTVTASNLLSGIKAYDNNGNLITGTSMNCVGGSFECDSECRSSTGKTVFNFQPKYFMMLGRDTGNAMYYNYDANGSNIYELWPKSEWITYTGPNYDSYFTITSNSMIVKNWTAGPMNCVYYYIACK